jgi:hypothetical protein
VVSPDSTAWQGRNLQLCGRGPMLRRRKPRRRVSTRRQRTDVNGSSERCESDSPNDPFRWAFLHCECNPTQEQSEFSRLEHRQSGDAAHRDPRRLALPARARAFRAPGRTNPAIPPA